MIKIHFHEYTCISSQGRKRKEMKVLTKKHLFKISAQYGDHFAFCLKINSKKLLQDGVDFQPQQANQRIKTLENSKALGTRS